MLQYEKTKDFEAVKKEIEQYIAKQEIEFLIYSQVMNIIKEFNGKDITKRIETRLKKELPQFTFSLENGSLIIIHVWGNGIDYSQRINIYLRQSKNEMLYNKYDHELTLQNSGYFPLIPKRNAKLKASLVNDGKFLKSLIESWNNAISILQRINKEAENWEYPISSIFDLQNKY